MSYKIFVTPNANENIENSIQYYKDNVSIKVANDFLNDLKKTYIQIKKVKYFYCFFENFREKSLKKFPFIVFYTIDEKNKLIIIKAVFHTSQNTEKYPKI